MRGRWPRIGIRQQLLGLFGLFLLTGALVLLLDEVAESHDQRTMAAMRDDVLAGMRGIRELSDAYGLDVVDTTFRTRNHLLGWGDAVRVVEGAQATSAREWQALQAAALAGEDAALLQQALQARPRADAAAAHLRAILLARDIRALGRFADQELYPAVDPLVQRLERIDRRGMLRADALVREQQARGARVRQVRIALSLLCFVLVLGFGRRILRNGYRGVESLAELTRRMGQHDYTAQPDYQPRGELGEVMASFLKMREHVRRIESQLTDQLASNDRVRVALERREQFQRLLLEAAQTAIVAVDEDGVFSQVNPFAEQLLGWPPGSLLGRETLDVILEPEALQSLARSLADAYGQPVPADWRALRQLARNREPPREFVLRHQRGRLLPVLLAVSAMRDEAGGTVGLLVVAADLTALKRLERALRDSEARAHEANQAKSAFLATMSHEIRTPMIGVTGMIEVLGSTRLDAEQRRALNVIQASADTLLQIIGDILDFSKIEAGKMELDPVPTALPVLLRNVVAGYAGSAASKGLALTCEVDPAVGPAHVADPVRLRQVIGNFLSNAIKFTERGSIVAGLDQRGQQHLPDGRLADVLVFRINDTGIGISASQQARLFQPFSQAEAHTTRRYGGSGLGLAISRRIAELMGGQVELESVPGVGTTLRLVVPLPATAADSVPALPVPAARDAGWVARRVPSVAEAEAARSLVLLVDDHPTNRDVIQRQLELAGFASEAANDGVLGLAAWRSGRFALVLSDVHMPHMDGYQLAAAIRADEQERQLPRTPIVALTASALKGDAERCLDAGMDDYLAKPVAVATLATCLLRWLPHAAAETREREGASDPPRSFTATDAVPVLQVDVLEALTGGDANDARQILQDFLASTDEDLAELARVLAAGDHHGITRQAHKVKGAARLVGAQALGIAAERLEAAGRSGEEATLASLAEAVSDAAAGLRAHAASIG